MTGCLDVDAVLESMTPEQLTGWAAYDQVEPLIHSERVLGLLAMMLNSALGGTEDITPQATPWVFEDDTPESPADLKERIKADGKHG